MNIKYYKVTEYADDMWARNETKVKASNWRRHFVGEQQENMSLILPVIVEGDWAPTETSRAKLKLELYFGSSKKSSGGECLVQLEDGAPKAALYFADAAGKCGWDLDQPVSTTSTLNQSFKTAETSTLNRSTGEMFGEMRVHKSAAQWLWRTRNRKQFSGNESAVPQLFNSVSVSYWIEVKQSFLY